jgi:hypothetical protein
MGPQVRSEMVVPQSADHPRWIPESRNGNGLIGALSSGMNLKSGSDYRLTNGWNPVGDCDQVSVDAAHDDDWPLFRQCPPRSKKTSDALRQRTGYSIRATWWIGPRDPMRPMGQKLK